MHYFHIHTSILKAEGFLFMTHDATPSFFSPFEPFLLLLPTSHYHTITITSHFIFDGNTTEYRERIPSALSTFDGDSEREIYKSLHLHLKLQLPADIHRVSQTPEP